MSMLWSKINQWKELLLEKFLDQNKLLIVSQEVLLEMCQKSSKLQTASQNQLLEKEGHLLLKLDQLERLKEVIVERNKYLT